MAWGARQGSSAWPLNSPLKNINDMYNNDVGKGVVYAYEAYEVK
jgi:hypothetical protein